MIWDVTDVPAFVALNGSELHIENETSAQFQVTIWVISSDFCTGRLRGVHTPQYVLRNWVFGEAESDPICFFPLNAHLSGAITLVLVKSQTMRSELYSGDERLGEVVNDRRTFAVSDRPFFVHLGKVAPGSQFGYIFEFDVGGDNLCHDVGIPRMGPDGFVSDAMDEELGIACSSADAVRRFWIAFYSFVGLIGAIIVVLVVVLIRQARDKGGDAGEEDGPAEPDQDETSDHSGHDRCPV
jgi:hypothetical protein